MTDFKLDENGDLMISEANHLVATESTLQHQSDIIWAEKAWWHFAPSLGVGLQGWLNENGSAPGLIRTIRQELERDGAKVDSVVFNSDGIKINATYTQ